MVNVKSSCLNSALLQDWLRIHCLGRHAVLKSVEWKSFVPCFMLCGACWLSLSCGGAILFDVCPGAVTILILTLLYFVKVHCRSDVSNVSNIVFTLTLSESCRNLGISNYKGHLVFGNWFKWRLFSDGKQTKKVDHLVCTMEFGSFISNCIV